MQSIFELKLYFTCSKVSQMMNNLLRVPKCKSTMIKIRQMFFEYHYHTMLGHFSSTLSYQYLRYEQPGSLTCLHTNIIKTFSFDLLLSRINNTITHNFHTTSVTIIEDLDLRSITTDLLKPHFKLYIENYNVRKHY
ncbi:uncharacterized protein Smp_201040 [Schistosoma mansoni]|uniref:uncharacterized protein n=1 Tax=Schistosoma mansoni TaxID=6183 RepID=UPI00022DC47B|nr:uncharacterized protein Smp_201040 [Schistosoma mansoni]|eukprot:XP_018648683.1 uncharacterized protein Smp_201040 [Schistosoma mansoni]